MCLTVSVSSQWVVLLVVVMKLDSYPSCFLQCMLKSQADILSYIVRKWNLTCSFRIIKYFYSHRLCESWESHKQLTMPTNWSWEIEGNLCITYSYWWYCLFWNMNGCILSFANNWILRNKTFSPTWIPVKIFADIWGRSLAQTSTHYNRNTELAKFRKYERFLK